MSRFSRKDWNGFFSVIFLPFYLVYKINLFIFALKQERSAPPCFYFSLYGL